MVGSWQQSAFGNELLYTGRRIDPATGLQLNRNRFYHQQLGRWVSRDPIGYWGGDENLYGYVGQMPTYFEDPLGLVPQDLGYTWNWDSWGDLGAYAWPWGGNEEIDASLGGDDAQKVCLVVGGTMTAVGTAGACTCTALGLETAVGGENLLLILDKGRKVGFRVDRAHHGKPWGHWHFWKW